MSNQHMIKAFGGAVTLRLYGPALRMAGLLCFAVIGIIALSLMSGEFPLSLPQVWASLTGNAPTEMAHTVIWEFRFPRALVSAMAGALIGLSGAILQAITRNPLADPSLVGVSQGASLAVVALVVAFPTAAPGLKPMVAFGGALLIAIVIQAIATGRGGEATMRFILTGIGVASFIHALTSALLTYGQLDRAQEALGWLAGSIYATGWTDVQILTLASLAALPLLIGSARTISALRMGPDIATVLGLDVPRTRAGLITLSVALAAIPVSVVGPLGFVGLVAPHMAHRLVKSGVGLHLVLTALCGGLLVAGADYIGRIAFAPTQIPAGLITAMIGAPLFIVLIIRGNPARQA